MAGSSQERPWSDDRRIDGVKRAFITGVAITVPAIVTIIVVQVAIGFIAGALAPVAVLLDYILPGQGYSRTALKVVAGGLLVTVVFSVGLVSNRTSGDRRARRFHAVMEAIPVVGSVYESFQEMSDLLLESDTETFEEVKLVEFPREGSYAVAFVTADTTSVLEDAVDREDLVTLYVPLAPNPVMGGFVVHVPTDQVHEVDMTVEQGVQSIITSGAALDDAHGVAQPPDREEGAVAVDTMDRRGWIPPVMNRRPDGSDVGGGT